MNLLESKLSNLRSNNQKLLEYRKKNNIKGYLLNEMNTSFETPKIVSNRNQNILIETGLQDIEVNDNNRLYLKETLESGLNTKYVKTRLETKSWYGEGGHPLNPDIKRQLWLDHSRISHRVNSVNWVGSSRVQGIVESAGGEMGKLFKECILQECKVGFSLRAVGPVTEKRKDGVLVVKPPLMMFCYDWVVQPSHFSAYMTKVISESSFFNEDPTLKNLLDNQDATFKDIAIELNESSIIDFILDSSETVKRSTESLELQLSKVTLLEDLSTIFIRDEHKQIGVGVFLEDSTVNMIDDFLINKFNK